MSPALTKGWQTRPVHVTVLILSVDEAHLLERSLPAALAQEPRPDVVVIDNASADATAELVRRHAARHREAWALRHRAAPPPPRSGAAQALGAAGAPRPGVTLSVRRPTGW